MNKIELKNGSTIETIDTSEVTRSKRGQEQLNNMKSAWDLIYEYYNSLPWYKKIITKIQWFFDDIVGFFIRLYYKIVIKILYKSK
jgi:hypothetical protein